MANGAKRSGASFGTSAPDPQAALDRYLAEKDELFARREPERQPERLSVEELIGMFFDAKQALVDRGEIGERSL